ncbi:hypothetical protein CEXT_159401 [Caerostris extrusa]|uniref:Uncharacterized protein n=1 Tax=Caerostris extrusa TaxID=172846 RepID=A0AAV4SYX8_CAEEX|nr:hypothetical protein CEXT_159401 [Caerostris extrusa]
MKRHKGSLLIAFDDDGKIDWMFEEDRRCWLPHSRATCVNDSRNLQPFPSRKVNLIKVVRERASGRGAAVRESRLAGTLVVLQFLARALLTRFTRRALFGSRPFGLTIAAL